MNGIDSCERCIFRFLCFYFDIGVDCSVLRLFSFSCRIPPTASKQSACVQERPHSGINHIRQRSVTIAAKIVFSINKRHLRSNSVKRRGNADFWLICYALSLLFDTRLDLTWDEYSYAKQWLKWHRHGQRLKLKDRVVSGKRRFQVHILRRNCCLFGLSWHLSFFSRNEVIVDIRTDFDDETKQTNSIFTNWNIYFFVFFQNIPAGYKRNRTERLLLWKEIGKVWEHCISKIMEILSELSATRSMKSGQLLLCFLGIFTLLSHSVDGRHHDLDSAQYKSVSATRHSAQLAAAAHSNDDGNYCASCMVFCMHTFTLRVCMMNVFSLFTFTVVFVVYVVKNQSMYVKFKMPFSLHIWVMAKQFG